eukprot:7959148-Pyramimonas_sp.AAC.1
MVPRSMSPMECLGHDPPFEGRFYWHHPDAPPGPAFYPTDVVIERSRHPIFRTTSSEATVKGRSATQDGVGGMPEAGLVTPLPGINTLTAAREKQREFSRAFVRDRERRERRGPGVGAVSERPLRGRKIG